MPLSQLHESEVCSSRCVGNNDCFRGSQPGTLLAGFTLQQIVSINPDINPDSVTEGQTILLPAGNLSSRDKEILEGIGTVYRIYPVRKGENFADIVTKRSITKDEMGSLNPGVNLDKLKGGSCRTPPPAELPLLEPCTAKAK